MAAVSIDERVRLPATAMVHGGFRAWALSPECPDHVRATFVAGEVVLEMSPESGDSHTKVKSRITSVLEELVLTLDLGEVYGDGMLLTHEAAGLSAEPDMTFVAWSTFESGRVHVVSNARREGDPIELVGSADVVLEVVSDSSVRKDTALLRDAYFRADVREYWLVDARGDDLRFEILHRAADGFVPSAPHDRPQRSEVFARTFILTRSKNRAGRHTYALEVT